MEKKECLDGRALITTVKIQDEAGSRAMKTDWNLCDGRISAYA